jgi:hypothetical protein
MLSEETKMSRKKMALGLVTMMVASIAIAFALNQPSNYIIIEDSDQPETLTNSTRIVTIKVMLPVQGRIADNGTYFKIITNSVAGFPGSHVGYYDSDSKNITYEELRKSEYTIINVTGVISVAIPDNATHRGFSEVVEEIILLEEMTDNYYYWDVTKYKEGGYGTGVYAYVKMKVEG